MALYLHLFHGRDDPEEDMDDWGFDGPTIGPLKFVHTTYTTDIKICFANAEIEQKFFPNSPPEFPDTRWIHINDWCLEYNNKFYGDWSVFDSTLTGTL